jgi:hypothetical protein
LIAEKTVDLGLCKFRQERLNEDLELTVDPMTPCPGFSDEVIKREEVPTRKKSQPTSWTNRKVKQKQA